MKLPLPKHVGRALSLFIMMPALALMAQATAQTGAISGRVENADGKTYLEHARVRIEGTKLERLTDPAGYYRFDSVPVGTQTLVVFYTGFPEQHIQVNVLAGDHAVQDFALTRETKAPSSGDVVQMSEYVVATEKETDAQALAINERRFAPNIENVVSTDAYGEINQGNIGEFVKHIPGVNIEYKDGNNPSGIDVRGLGTNYTRVTVDGYSMASAAIGNTQTPNRQFVLEGASINNYSRIEVSKEPLPNIPANSMGGSVNLVSKSAFEYAGPTYGFATYLSGNSYAMDIGKVGGIGGSPRHQIVPSFSGEAIVPITKKLGIVVTANDYDQFYQTHKEAPLRTFNGVATAANPYTQGITATSSPNEVRQVNGSVKLDWKLADGSVFTTTAMANAYRQDSASYSIGYNTGSSPISWSDTYTNGGVGKASAPSLGSSAQNRNALTRFVGATYTYDKDDWKIVAGGSYSNANNRIRDNTKGFFDTISVTAPTVKTIDYSGFDNGTASVGKVTTLDASGNPVDTTQLANYSLNSAGTTPMSATDNVTEEHLDVSRTVETPWFPVTFTVGGDTNDLHRDIKYDSLTYTYVGPDGAASSGDEGLGAYVDPTYVFQPGFGLPSYQETSPWVIYQLYKNHPNYFTITPANAGSEVKSIATRSPLLMERVTAFYAMADAKFFKDRLRLVGGVRYELTQDSGYGYKQDGNGIYQKDANGNPIVVNGAFVLLPTLAGTVSGGPEQSRLTYIYRGLYNARSYHDYYPSAAGTFNVTDNLILRAAYAETMGRPSPSDIVPNLYVGSSATFDPNVSGSIPGYVTSSNTTLKPWTSKNYDLSIEYYLPHNGIASIGVFRKDIKHFFATVSQIVTPELAASLGLSDDDVGFQYSTRVNGGSARIDGIEFDYGQELDFIPVIGKHFSLIANLTKFTVTGANSATFDLKNNGGNIPLTANAALAYTFGRLSGHVAYNYRGKELRDTSSSYAGAMEYVLAQQDWDVDVAWQLNKHYSVFAACRNINNGPQRWSLDGPVAPQWSHLENYYTNGAQYSFGVRGTY